MRNASGKWVHPPGWQSITTPSSAKTETSLVGYYTAESSHHNSCTNGVNETQWLPLLPRNRRPHDLRLPLSHSQSTPRTTRPLPTAEEKYTARLFHPPYHPPTNRELHGPPPTAEEMYTARLLHPRDRSRPLRNNLPTTCWH
jgi:hypothetical protein